MRYVDYEVEKYVVHYSKFPDVKKRAFDDEGLAVAFAREKMNEGYEVTIKQINIMTGWY